MTGRIAEARRTTARPERTRGEERQRGRPWGLARRLARHLLRLPDRLLHPLRRRLTRRRLARLPLPERILFVCLGNICRSPYAAEALRARLPPSLGRRIDVGSAGLLYEEGRRSPAEAVEVAARRGIDLRPHRSAIAGPVRESPRPLVFVMDPKQRARLLRRRGHRPERTFVLGDLDPQPVRTRAIVDPFGHGEEMFEEVYARVDRCVEEAARLIGSRPAAT